MFLQYKMERNYGYSLFLSLWISKGLVNNKLQGSSSHREVSAAVKGVLECKNDNENIFNKNDMVTCMFFEYNINK